MSVISGTRRGMKELVDGTIRVQIDIDPIHRADFFALFSRIDMPVALAPLVANFEQIKPADQNTETDREFKQKPNVDKAVSPLIKGGELAKWAGILSADPYWWGWLEGYLKAVTPIASEASAAHRLRLHLRLTSRAELDHNPEAAKEFRHMMREFSEWRDGGKAA